MGATGVSQATEDAASGHGRRQIRSAGIRTPAIQKVCQPRDAIERTCCRLYDFTGFAIRQQELAKAAAIGAKWQDIFPSCREIAG
jgi:hypothetical protein